MKNNKFSKNLILFLVLSGLLLIPVVSLGLFRYTGESNVLSFSDIRNPLSDVSMPKLNLGGSTDKSDEATNNTAGSDGDKVPGPGVELPSNFVITKYVVN